jgi:hypothetical protein
MGDGRRNACRRRTLSERLSRKVADTARELKHSSARKTAQALGIVDANRGAEAEQAECAKGRELVRFAAAQPMRPWRQQGNLSLSEL